MKCVRFLSMSVVLALFSSLLLGAAKEPRKTKTKESKTAEAKTGEAASGVEKTAEAKPAEAKPEKTSEPKQPSAVTPSEKNNQGWKDRVKTINDRVKQGKDKAKQGEVDLIFIGDSITQGWEGKGGKDIWEKSYGKRNAVNMGISGDRTQHVLWRLDNGHLEGISPKLAVVMIGTNNSSQNKPEDIAAGIKAIVERLRAKLPQTKVLVLGIFPRGEDDNNKQRQVNMKTNEIVSKLADDKQVYYLDIGAKFLGPDRKLSAEVMPDRLHLSAKGYQIWAEAIEPSVTKLMGE